MAIGLCTAVLSAVLYEAVLVAVGSFLLFFYYPKAEAKP